MHPDNPNAFAGFDGAVRNFTWKISGAKPDVGYYGSPVKAYGELLSFINMPDVELTLTPDGVLIDGSAGAVIKKRLVDVGGGEYGIDDVPIGKYTITARNAVTNQPLEIRIRNTGNYANAVSGIFNSDYPVTEFPLSYCNRSKIIIMKKIISIALLSFYVFTVSAQVTDTSYHLLWYKGKKLKENVLLTTKADTVSFNPVKGTIKVDSKSGRGKQFDDMLRELNKTPQRMREMVSRLMTGLPKDAMPAVLYNVSSAYNEIKEEYIPILSNTFTIPEFQLPEVTTAIPGNGPSMDEDYFAVDPFDGIIKELYDYMDEHRNDKFNASELPVPPVFNFEYCYSCDIEKKEAYNTELENFKNDFANIDDDKDILQKTLSTSRQAGLTLSAKENEAVQNKLRPVIEFIWKRISQKTRVLMDKYFDDPQRCHAVLQLALSAERQNQMTGVGEPMPEGFFFHALTTVVKYISKAMDEKNYPVALNLNLILSLERQFQLFGGTAPDNFLSKAFHFNQFKLNMNISAKVIGDGGYQLAQVKGDNWFSAFPDSTCHLIWVQVGPFINKTKVDLLAAELKGNGGEIPYVGTKIWNSDIPTIKIDFCRRDNLVDSITAYPFHPEGFKELWNMPKMGPMNMALMNNVLVNCFIDVARAKQDAAKFKNNANVEKLKTEMLAQYQQMMNNYKSGNWAMPERASLNELSSIAKGQQNNNKISEIIHSANPGRYIFEPTVHNKEKVVLKERLNGKEIFPANRATEYAFFHLTLEHDPDGPYPFAK